METKTTRRSKRTTETIRGRRAAGKKKDTEPRRPPLRLHLDEEVFDLLEKDAHDSGRPRTGQAEVLLSNAIRASWAYDFGRICSADDRPAVEAAYDFFSELYHLQAAAREAMQSASIAAQKAAGEAAKRCQQWLDAEKARRAFDAAGEKAIGGKGGSAQPAATS